MGLSKWSFIHVIIFPFMVDCFPFYCTNLWIYVYLSHMIFVIWTCFLLIVWWILFYWIILWWYILFQRDETMIKKPHKYFSNGHRRFVWCIFFSHMNITFKRYLGLIPYTINPCCKSSASKLTWEKGTQKAT